jgi:hypothetical protein
LGHPDFLETVTRLRKYLDHFRANWWIHCFPEKEGFSFQDFRQGLDWFLEHTECPGCKGGKGMDLCPIRSCAKERGLEHCSLCPDLEVCDKFEVLIVQFPDVKANLRRRRLKIKAKRLHQQLAAEKTEG